MRSCESNRGGWCLLDRSKFLTRLLRFLEAASNRSTQGRRIGHRACSDVLDQFRHLVSDKQLTCFCFQQDVDADAVVV